MDTSTASDFCFSSRSLIHLAELPMRAKAKDAKHVATTRATNAHRRY